MERLALVIFVLLAVAYVGAAIIFSFLTLPMGLLPLLGLLAMGLFFLKALRAKLNNSEDKKYNDKVEP